VSVIAIINPISGGGTDTAIAGRRVAMLRTAAQRRGIDIGIHLTERAGHARELAQSSVAAGARLVIAWGGDGTINETGAALIGTSTVLGVIPAGSGNGLAAALAVPYDADAAIQAAFDGAEWTIDAGMMGGRPFFNVGGVGFDARIARLFNQQPRGRRGGWPYVRLGVTEGWRYAASEYSLELDGTPRRVRAFLIAFANGREYGMGARIAPQAALDDGILDVTVVEDRPRLARFWHARHLATGHPDRAACVSVHQVRAASIESDGPMELHVDGETDIAHERIDVRIVPGALTVKVPGRNGKW
jgi:diacylglycerol kinase (ATP)